MKAQENNETQEKYIFVTSGKVYLPDSGICTYTVGDIVTPEHYPVSIWVMLRDAGVLRLMTSQYDAIGKYNPYLAVYKYGRHGTKELPIFAIDIEDARAKAKKMKPRAMLTEIMPLSRSEAWSIYASKMADGYIDRQKVDIVASSSVVDDGGTPESEYEHVNHPKHYNQYDREVIDMMVDIWGKEYASIWCVITAFKYRMRMGLKPENDIDQDLAKEEWYLNKATEIKNSMSPLENLSFENRLEKTKYTDKK